MLCCLLCFWPNTFSTYAEHGLSPFLHNEPRAICQQKDMAVVVVVVAWRGVGWWRGVVAFVCLLTHRAADCTQVSFAMHGGVKRIKKPVWYHINSSESPNAKFVLSDDSRKV